MKNSVIWLCVLSAVVILPAKAAAVPRHDGLVVWSGAPARRWAAETYPLGTGRLGFMSFGGTKTEHIQFNEDTLWIGDESDTGAYQNFGDILITLNHSNPEDYRRCLDIRNAVQTITYRSGGVRYKREYFASYPHRVLVFRFTAEEKGALDAVIALKDAHNAKTVVEGKTLVARGNLAGFKYKHSKRPYKIALDYEARVLVKNEGGKCTAVGGRIILKGADSFTILVAAGTDFVNKRSQGWKGEHPHRRLVALLKSAAEIPYRSVLEAHVAEFRRLFDTFSLELGETDPALAAAPTAERLAAYRNGAKDPDLEELFFQFARYLMLSSSRPGGLPANLQGLWNNSNNPPWRCDFHSDVNIEMNYWFVDIANLSECFAPFADWLNSVNPVRAEETEKTFGSPGWLHHAENGPFGGSTWKWSKGDAAWMLQNLWDHYAFTLDRRYLESQVYPLMKSLCEFWTKQLKELPDGTLVVPDGYSPEHGPVEDGVSFDQQLVWNLFDDFRKASEILGKDEKLRQKVAAMQKRLLGPKIGRWGQLQEWRVDRDRPDDHHRHLSHMIAVHPGHQISPHTTPKLAEAAKVSMNARGDGGTGWSKAWKIAIWARLHDGDRAYKLLSEFVKKNVYPSLLGFHPPFQIDCNFGYAAGVCEMLLQSHMGFIEFLPALPKAWPEGSVRGIKARGAFVLDIEWAKGKLKRAVIRSLKGTTCRIYSRRPLIVSCGGKPVEVNRAGCIHSFPTHAGDSYLVMVK